MKKIMFCMAVAGMFAFASCGNNSKPAEEQAECNAEATEIVEENAEATEAVENAAEETVEAVATEEAAQ